MVDIAGKQIPKWLIVLVAVGVVVGVAGNISSCIDGTLEREQAQNTPKRPTQPTVQPDPLPSYEIVNVEDVSVGAIPRFDYRVVVSGKPTPGQLDRVAKAVFKKAQRDETFSALRVGFYDYPEFAGREFTLGVVDFAPDGDWAKASTIEPGDYDSMKARADLPTKDWSKQLSPDEVKVWAAWWAEYRIRADAIGSDPSKVVDEGAVTRKIADATGKSADQVQAILTKQQVWTSQ